MIRDEDKALTTPTAHAKDVWQFQAGLEKKQQSAQDMITVHKRALYELAKIERELPVLQKKQEDMEQLALTEDIYKVLAEQHKGKLIELESRRHKYEEQAKEFDEDKCMADTRAHNEYLEAAKTFLQEHRYLHKMVELKHVVDKKAMENLVTDVFRKAMAQFETYESLKNNWMYKMLPFTKPWNHDEHLQETQLALLQKIKRIQTIVHYFPEVQARLDYERTQTTGIRKLEHAIQGWIKRAIESGTTGQPMEKDKKFCKDVLAIKAEMEDMMKLETGSSPTSALLFQAVLMLEEKK